MRVAQLMLKLLYRRT